LFPYLNTYPEPCSFPADYRWRWQKKLSGLARAEALTSPEELLDELQRGDNLVVIPLGLTCVLTNCGCEVTAKINGELGVVGNHWTQLTNDGRVLNRNLTASDEA